MPCLFEGCDLQAYGQGYCRKHYYWARRHGIVESSRRTDTRDEADRFHQRYQKAENGCWLWQSTIGFDGYPVFVDDRARNVRAHRFSYQIAHGPIPHGQVIRHRCDTPTCVNPAHLLPGTHADNVQDCVERQRNAFGERNGRRKLSHADVRAIRQQYAAGGITQTQLAKQYDMSPSGISRVITGENWTR
jgi:hypothetical protein